MKVTLSRDLTILFTMLAMVTQSSAADVMLGEDEPVSDHKGDFVEDLTTSKTTGLQTDETSELITSTGSPNMAPSPPTSCNVAISMTCFVEDAQGTKTNCKDVIPKPDDECVKEVKYTYIVTNNGDHIEKNIMSLDRTRDGEVKDLSDFLDVHETPLGHFGIASETDTLDFCMPRNVTTTVGIQSEQDFGVGDLTCSDQDTHSFPIHIMCDVDVKIDCFADEVRDFQVPCNQFKPNLSGIRKSSCEHALKYVYTVTNSGSGSEAVSGITTVMQDGTKKNILPGPFDLEPDETMEFTDVMIVDYCENDFPNGMNTSIEVMANVLSEGSTTCSGVDEYSLNLSETSCNLNINPSIRCTTLDVLGSEVSCLDYISGIDDFTDPSQCMKEVKYEITLINQGLSCMDIESATGRLEGRRPVAITSLEGNNVSVCPNKNVDVVHYTEQNMCDDDLDSAMIVEVNGGPEESCGGFGTLNYLPVPKSIEESQVELSLSCSDQYGDECVVAQDQQECDSHPTYLDLKFTGKPCNASVNDLGPLFTCYDFDPMQDVSEAYITIESKEDGVYFEAPVTKGKMVRLGDEYRKLPADLVLNIQAGRNGSLLQKMKFRASCNEPISTRNVFGSLTLLGFGDGEKTVVATENEFEIQYEVKNVGETTVLLEGMLISANDEEISRVSIGGLYQLPAGATYRGSETVEISASATDVKAVTVVGRVVAESLSAIKSNAQDSIKIDVMLPPTPRLYNGGKASSYPKFSFFVMGDTPYNPEDAKILVDQVDQISKTDALFLVHVGDLMKQGKCRPKSYREASNILFGGSLSDPSPSFRPLPTFVIPGDNDWVDCPDTDIAYKRFTRFFVKNNNSTHGMDKQLSFQRQSQRKENFVLWKHNVLFLGLNMLRKQEITWRKRYEENTQWLQDQTEKYRSEEIRMIVIFAHLGNSNHPVYRTIQRFSRKSGIPILYIHGNGHFFKVVQHRKQIASLQVDRGGIAQPLKVTIGDSSPVKRRDFELFSGLVQVARKWDV